MLRRIDLPVERQPIARIGNCRDAFAFSENCYGPRIEFRGALPHSPGAGGSKAAGFA